MEKTREHLHFSSDFKQACEIFDLKPLDVLQQFMDNVSLPSYFAEPMSPDRWANTFMLECVLSRLEATILWNDLVFFLIALPRRFLVTGMTRKKSAGRLWTNGIKPYWRVGLKRL